MSFSIQSAINEACKSEDREKTSWYASDMGKCLSGVYYARMGLPVAPKDDRLLRVFKCGNIFEDFVLESAAKHMKVERPETMSLKEFDLRVRPDAIVNDEVVYEVKSVHSRKFTWMGKEGPDKHHLQQLWWGMKATGKQEGRLIYVSKDDLRVAEYRLLLTDPEISTACLSEIAILQEAWKTKTPPEPVPTFVNGKLNWKAQYCDYHQHCLGDPNWLANIKDGVEKGNNE
jgi:hypothetical protein